MFNEDNLIPNKNNKIFISLGNYCLPSMLLKENNIKYESYPFDWMVSCIDNINHCIEDNFENFLSMDNYTNINNKTKNIKYFNKTKNIKYFDNTNKLFENLIIDHQHHNLLDNKDYNYLKRCVQRFNSLGEISKELIFIMVQPLYLNENIFDYNENKDKILNLYNNLCNKFNNNIKLIIFIIKNKNNKVFKEEIINLNLKIIELDTEMIVGNYDMMYFDENGIKKFLQIIQNF
jgi:hypothetical protein